jgi:hypothetical protein
LIKLVILLFFRLPAVARMTGISHLAFFLLRWGSLSLCPGWPGTGIFPISASQVARITGMSHWCLARIYVFKEIKLLHHSHRLFSFSLRQCFQLKFQRMYFFCNTAPSFTAYHCAKTITNSLCYSRLKM